MKATAPARLLQFLKRTVIWLSIAILFGVAHTQNLLYSGNQNSKLLHGLARAGKGLLSQDWTAQTADPLPLFSALAGFTYRFMSQYFFYLYFVALLGVYIYSVMGIFTPTHDLDRSRALRTGFFAAVVVLYSGFIATFVQRAIGSDGLRSGLSGVAQQYLLGPIFQPSVFGVFLVLSILLFLRRRPFLAGLAVAVACSFHSAYIFCGATLTMAYMFLVVRDEHNWKKALLLGGFTLLLVIPVLFYSRWFLAPTSPEASRRALEILVIERIPQHSLPSVWFDKTVVLKLLIAAAALYLLRGKQLFWILAIPLAAGLILTLAQIATGSLRLAMLAPWRVTAFIVPLSEFTIIASLLAFLSRRMGPALGRLEIPLLALSCAVVAFCFLGGAWLQARRFVGGARSDSTALYSFVDHSKKEGDLYLVSPYGLAGLRLNAGVPVLVTWKSHPYKDVEVLEWRRRVQDARAFYAAKDSSAALEQLAALRSRYGITHVVLGKKDPLLDPGSGSVVFSNRSYRVVELAAP